MRLKEEFASTIRDKNAMAEENRQLKEILRQHRIAFPGLDQYGHGIYTEPGAFNSSSPESQPGSYTNNQTFTPPTSHGSALTPPGSAALQAGSELIGGPQSMHPPGLDVGRVGIEFVLASVDRPSGR